MRIKATGRNETYGSLSPPPQAENEDPITSAATYAIRNVGLIADSSAVR